MVHFNWFFRSENSINKKIERIQQGDKDLREKVIDEYRPFIIKTISCFLGRYIDIENSEEYSIGLSAFNESIDRYDLERGSNFFKYSKLIINSRIIDYKRIEQKNSNSYPFSYFDEIDTSFENKYLIDNENHFEVIEVRDEILAFKKTLNEFKINFDDLVSYSPKHKDSIKLCVKIARVIADDDILFTKLSFKKNIPLKELLTRVNVHQRTIERNRKFIITVALILKSNLDVLKSYVENVENGGESLE